MISKAAFTALCFFINPPVECFLQVTPIKSTIKSVLKSHQPSGIRSAKSLHSTESANNEKINISIEYCSGCQWMLRSTWLASELLTTFSQETKLASITLVPKSPPLSPGGIFRVLSKDELSETVLWDRNLEGRFPEAKEVKQAVRDVVNPSKELGHSDLKEEAAAGASLKSKKEKTSATVDCVECNEREKSLKDVTSTDSTAPNDQLPPAFYEHNSCTIEFSTGSTIYSNDNKMHQAINYANEVLSIVYERNAWWKAHKDIQPDELKYANAPVSVDEVTLVPIRDSNGVLNVRLNANIIFDQLNTDSQQNIKCLVAQSLTPEEKNARNEQFPFEMMSNDEADEARKYFGVY